MEKKSEKGSGSLERRGAVEGAGGRFLGMSRAAIEPCDDVKTRLDVLGR